MTQTALFELTNKQRTARTLLPEYPNPVPKLSLRQVEKFLRETGALGDKCSRDKIVELIEEGKLKGVQFEGNLWMVTRASLAEYLRSLDEPFLEQVA